MAGAAALETLATGPNERQRAYLLAAYDENQAREAKHGGPGGLPARRWRRIEYGPVGAKWLDGPGSRLLRAKLVVSGMVSQGTGTTWAAPTERGLLTTRYENIGLIDTRSRRAIQSLMVRLTTDGRKVARLLRGELPTRPRSKDPKLLSLSALGPVDAHVVLHHRVAAGISESCLPPRSQPPRQSPRRRPTGARPVRAAADA